MLRDTARPARPRPTSVRFGPSFAEVRTALANARDAWDRAGIGKDTCDVAEQVLAEVLNNVVEHAMADRSGGLIEMHTHWSDTGLLCHVRDDGHHMPGLDIPAGKMADLGETLDALPEGGFGWFLIRTLTKDLSYIRHGEWNHFQFRIPSADASSTCVG